MERREQIKKFMTKSAACQLEHTKAEPREILSLLWYLVGYSGILKKEHK